MNFELSNLLLGVLFSLVGFGAWRYGRQISSARHMILAIVLMTFGYFVPNTWLTLLIGGILTALLFWP